MIKYNFKVEVSFRDKTNNKKEVKKGAVIQITEERLKELNEAQVGRVVSAEYVEDEKPTQTKKAKKEENSKEEKEDKKEEKSKEVKEDKKEEKSKEVKEDKKEESSEEK